MGRAQATDKGGSLAPVATTNATGYKWIALLALSVGTFVVSFNLSMIFTAVPEIMKEFGVTVSTASWIGIAYALSFAGLQPMMGNLGDMRGKKMLFSLGLVIFTVGSALAAASWDIVSMGFSRFVQGIGAAAVFPTGMAIIGDVFPREERGKAFGIWGIAGSAGPGIGITFGGLVFDFFNNWRAIYGVSIVLGIASLLVALALLRPSETSQNRKKVDYMGSLAFVATIGFLLLLIYEISAEASVLLLLSIGFLASAFVFVMIERGQGQNAAVDIGLLKKQAFLTVGLTAFFSFVALQGTLFLLPFFLENIRLLSATTAGVLATPLFVALAIGSLVGGRISDKFGTRVPAVLGGAASTLGLYLFSYLNGETAYWYIAMASTLSGIGIGVVLPPLGRAVLMFAPPEKRGSVSGAFNTMRNIGGPFGVAILPQFLETSIKAHIASSTLQQGINQRIATYQAAIQGFSDTFLLATAICFVGVLMAATIPRAKHEQEGNPNSIPHG